MLVWTLTILTAFIIAAIPAVIGLLVRWVAEWLVKAYAEDEVDLNLSGCLGSIVFWVTGWALIILSIIVFIAAIFLGLPFYRWLLGG